MTIIIGIDPGSRQTGYGVIRCAGNQSTYVASGCLYLTGENPGKRLTTLYTGLQAIMQQYLPEEAAIEQVFMHQNPGSALKLGQARGAAIVAIGLQHIAEYSARQVKQSVVGYGAATKDQVQHMVKQLLCLKMDLQADEADGLAIALCHAHSRTSLVKIGVSTQRKHQRKASSWRNYKVFTEDGA